MIVLRPVEECELSYSFPEYAIRRFRVLLSTDQARAVYADEHDATEERDEELAAIATRLQTPLVVPHKLLGELTLNRRHGWFEGTARWNGRRVDLTLHPGEKLDLSRNLQVAERLWDQQQEWKQKVDAYAVQKLLPLKNSNWLDEDENEPPLTPTQFLGRMALSSISIDHTGKFEFWHDDGDLFFGHSIQISGSLKEGLTRADIPG